MSPPGSLRVPPFLSRLGLFPLSVRGMESRLQHQAIIVRGEQAKMRGLYRLMKQLRLDREVMHLTAIVGGTCQTFYKTLRAVLTYEKNCVSLEIQGMLNS